MGSMQPPRQSPSASGDESACIDALRRRAVARAALGDSQAALTDVNDALASHRSDSLQARADGFLQAGFQSRAARRLQSGDCAAGAGEAGPPGARDRRARAVARISRSARQPDVQLKARDRGTDRVTTADGYRSPSRIDLQTATNAGAIGLTLRGDAPATSSPTGGSPRDLELRSFVTASPSAAADLVATAARLQSTLVVYWVGANELFVWAVTPEGAIHSRRVPVLPGPTARAHSRDRAVY